MDDLWAETRIEHANTHGTDASEHRRPSRRMKALVGFLAAGLALADVDRRASRGGRGARDPG